jgi:cyclopropane fatty-acyl-phospholipid synthase-like methyltransferase
MLKQKNYILKNYGKELFLKYEYYFTICEAGFNTNMMGIGQYVIIKGDTVNLSNSFIY